MSSHDKSDNRALQAIVVNQSLSATDKCVSALRNQGLAVHAKSIQSTDDLLQHDMGSALDLALIGTDESVMPLDQVLLHLAPRKDDVAILLLAADPDPALLKQYAGQGVRDVIQLEAYEHLAIATRREINNLQTRRQLARCNTRLAEAENRCQSLIGSSRDAIAYIHDGMHMYANAAYLQLFGYLDEDELAGLPIMDLVADNDREPLKRLLRLLADGEARDIELACRNGAGDTFDARMSFVPATYEGEPCTQLMVENRSADIELERRIRLLSDQDPHTGLANRSSFMQLVDGVFTDDRQSEPRALIYIIVDNFQQVRAEHGLAAGDHLLQEIASAIGPLVDEKDVLARFGDQSFTLLSCSADRRSATELAERISHAVDLYDYPPPLDHAKPTLSIGISQTDDPSSRTAQDFVNHAYRVCNRLHHEGGNAIECYDATTALAFGDEPPTAGSTELIQQIDFALEHDQFRLVFQPIVSIQGDTRQNYAVLLRLQDRNDEELLPEFFLPQAEAAGRMADIDRWVVRNAIAELARQRRDGERINFYLQLSAAGISDEGMLLWICDSLRDYNAKGAWLTFEFHYEDVRANLTQAEQLMQGLQKINCRVAVDHFGLNGSVDQLLKRLPLHAIKFHQQLLDNLANDEQKQQDLLRLNNRVQQSKVKTIATAVEDANSLAVLWSVGVNYIQGFFLQEPSAKISYDFKN